MIPKSSVLLKKGYKHERPDGNHFSALWAKELRKVVLKGEKNVTDVQKRKEIATTCGQIAVT